MKPNTPPITNNHALDAGLSAQPTEGTTMQETTTALNGQRRTTMLNSLANAMIVPPQPEAAPTVDAVADKGSPSERKQAPRTQENQATRIVKLAEENVEYFTGNQDGKPYARITESNGSRYCIRLTDKRFDSWLAELYYKATGDAPNSQARKDALVLLSMKSSKAHEDIFLRIGGNAHRIYIDIGDDTHEAIEVDAEGWRIVDCPPVNFRRSAIMQPLTRPVKSEDTSLLLKHLNIEAEDLPLVSGWLAAALRPVGPYPVLALLSRAGSAKSTLLKTMQMLIDPSAATARSNLKDVRSVATAAQGSWLLPYDNISAISDEVSDMLCTIATGGSFTTRANYTDDEEVVINVQRPVILNGIGDIISRSDLMDRAIPIRTPYIPPRNRKSEKQYWREFDEDRPRILGAFLHAVSVGLSRVDSIVLEEMPRMADFAQWGAACEPAFACGEGDFIRQYAENRATAAEAIIEGSPLGETLLKVMGTSQQIVETPENLFLKLKVAAGDSLSEFQKSSAFPRHHNQLKTWLERLASALDQLGIEIRHGGKQRVEVGGTPKRVFTIIRSEREQEHS